MKMCFLCCSKFLCSVYILQWILCIINASTPSSASELTINVQNQGGEVVQETITSNLDDDSIILEFQRTDGTLITQLLDFRNEVQILKALVLGEEERGQSEYQVMCFVTKFLKSEFISTDAMAKLRQKNPSTIRQPEEDRGRDNYTMTGWVKLPRSMPVSRHIASLCSEAADSTYIRNDDIKSWATKPVTACSCLLEMCIGWYPCGLKFCKGKIDNGLGNNASYRCGIKTCRKCNQFMYYVQQKQQCLWDD